MNARLKIAAAIMRGSIERAVAARAFNVELIGKESIFDALIRAGHAIDFAGAVAMVGRRFPPEQSTWNDLAAWVESYSAAEAPPQPPVPGNLLAKK